MRVPRDEYALELGLPDGRSSWVVCEECGLVYQSPRPNSAVVADLYEGGEYHETRGGVPEHYVRYSLRRSQRALDWVFAHPALVGRTGRALDIGCGIGGAVTNLRSRGWEASGVEPDPNLATIGRSRFGLDIVDGFFSASSFAKGTTFDLAYSCHVWEHLADPMATTRAVHELLAPSAGILVIVVPTFRRARTLAWTCFAAPHTYMFTDVSLGNVLRATGFEPLAHRFAAGGDSELWMMARAVPEANATPQEERLSDIQRELSLVPLKFPLGLPGRVLTHARTLAADPKEFGRRVGRWTRYQAGRVGRAVKPRARDER
ncbi:MAG: hypothetical protein QOI61_2216 [Actinomycetota bacterium]|jgi:SAM-dependent methyltransferase